MNNLPVQLTSIIGREQELAFAARQLRSTRLLSITGPGGVGKTRLALGLAADQLERFEDGAWFVPLEAVANPDLIAQAVATALAPMAEVKESLQESLIRALGRTCARRRFLLVLDNCEHLVAHCALFAREMLAACPGLTIVATSREPLGIGGEMVMEVAPLGAAAAVQLFAERAGAIQAGFAVTPQNREAVAQICARLDGIPLAIELAAARVRVLPPAELAGRLQDRFALLTSGDRLAMPRHKTLRAVVEWSYNLLTEPEQTLWRRLSVFAGGFELPAAEAVCQGAPIDEGDALPLLLQLAEKSIVKVERSEDGARYILLETIRAFGLELLQAAGEEASVRRRHLAWYGGWAAEIRPKLMGAETTLWYNRLVAEIGNLQAALAWSKEDAAVAETGLIMAKDLNVFWQRWRNADGLQHLEELLALPHLQAPSLPRFHSLNAAASICVNLLLHGRARAHWEEALSVARSIGFERGEAVALHNLGFVAFEVGEYETALALFAQTLPINERLNIPAQTASCLANMGFLHLTLGDSPRAAELFAQALGLHETLDWPAGRMNVLMGAGANHLRLGNRDEATRALAESLAIVQKLAFPDIGLNTLEWTAEWLLENGRAEHAAQLLGSAAAARAASTAPRPAFHQPAYDRRLALVKERLGEPSFNAQFALGEAIAPDAAIDWALELLAEPGPSAAPIPAGLSPREMEVVLLVAQGLPDREVAAQLHLSRFTVNNHLRSIYGKLGISSRSALVTWAFQNGLAKAR